MFRATLTARTAARWPCRRPIHTSPSTLAKKKTDAFADDLFDDADGDMFGEATSQSQSEAVSSSAQTPSKKAPKVQKERPRMPAAERTKRYNKLLEFALPRITAGGVDKRKFKHPPFLRHTAFSQLLQLAATPEQLAQVAELISPLKTNCSFEFGPEHVEHFVRRCDSLACPQLALKVFGDFPHYQFPLTRPAAQQLMHTLYRNDLPAEVMTVAALYPVHGLGPVERDIVASAILAAASVKAGHKGVERGVLKEIRGLLGIGATHIGETWKDHSGLPDKWVKTYLRHVDNMIEKRDGSAIHWLRTWRQRSIPKGSTPAPA